MEEFVIRTAVVTGAASGIGLALARELHARGAHLVLVDRDAGALGELAEELGARAVAMDVADPSANEELAELAGTTDLVCLNAGVVSTHAGPAWEAPPDEWRRVLDVNLGGVVNGLRAFVPAMIADGAPHRILITASLAGLATWPGGGPYAASKHAVLAVAEQTALALAEHPIAVAVLCPALVRTGMSDIGDEPTEVAVTALEGIDDGRFLVFPDDWAAAVTDRADRLASGRPPSIPMPRTTTS